MARFLDPPKAKPQLPQNKIEGTYRKMRLKVFLGAFFGYAAYYLVRKNLSIAAPDMIAEGLLDKAGVGIAASALSIAYAFSKFIMGSVSDRSDARKFLVLGLLLAAGVMIVTGLLPYSTTNTALNVGIIFVAMLVVGWLSGMGWPPCGRVMAHWFSQSERSFKMSVWNTSHNVGGGSMSLLVSAGIAIMLALGFTEQTWRAAFIFPSIVAIAVAIFCWWALRDRPEACGLPAVEDWRNDHSGKKAAEGEEEKIPFKRLFIDYVFKNKLLWSISLANAFIYMVRYGIGDWAPTYLQETGIMNADQSRIAFALYEYAAIPGTIICGWVSSKFFKGRCAPVNVIFIILTLIGILLYWKVAPVSPAMVYISLSLIGFCIYGPVALIGIQALSLVPKNAAGTAAGFSGLFGYLVGDALLAKIIMGRVAQNWGWNPTFWMFVVGCAVAILLCWISGRGASEEAR